MDAGKRTINDIFNGNRALEVPFFQRSYVWDEVQWERLLDDMELVGKHDEPYFLGSIILKQKETGSSDAVGDLRVIVDGQQRLTTFSIFSKSYFLKTGSLSTFDRIFKLIDGSIALKHNHNDIERYEEIMNLESVEERPYRDHISRAFNYFMRNIEVDSIDYNSILKHTIFVGIDLSANEDEQQIFDTINSLGVRLTTAELLKNYLFSRDDIELYEKNWKQVFECDEETKEYWDRVITAGRLKRENIDLFFYSYLQIKIHDKSVSVNQEDRNTYSKVDNLFESFKSFISKYKINRGELISDIRTYAKLYKDNIDATSVDKEMLAGSSIQRMNVLVFGLENTTLIPYLLYIIKEVSSNEERNKIFSFLEAYVMRRLVCKASNKNYNQLFTDRLLSKQLVTRDSLQSYIVNEAGQTNMLPSDDEMKLGFESSKLTNKQAAGILYFIESKIRDVNKQSTSLLGLSRYSLEHIMPKKWINNWDGPADTESKKNRDAKLLTLGNLAIITSSLNSSIRDSAWSKKKKGASGKHGLEYFSGGIETLSMYLSQEVWDENVINCRASDLCTHALGAWKVE